jgi:hypothetical protein
MEWHREVSLKLMAFKRLTAAQRRALMYLRALGEMLPNPQDARSLKVLARRGLVRYRKRDGIRYAVLRDGNAEAAEKRRLKRATRYFGWTESGEREHHESV